MSPGPRLLSLLWAIAFGAVSGCGGDEVIREITNEIAPKMRVEVSIRAGGEEPTAEDLANRKRLEDRIEQENIGRLVSTTGGAGHYGLTVEVDNTADAIPRIQEILRSMDLARDAKFKVMEVR